MHVEVHFVRVQHDNQYRVDLRRQTKTVDSSIKFPN